MLMRKRKVCNECVVTIGVNLLQTATTNVINLAVQVSWLFKCEASMGPVELVFIQPTFFGWFRSGY